MAKKLVMTNDVVSKIKMYKAQNPQMSAVKIRQKLLEDGTCDDKNIPSYQAIYNFIKHRIDRPTADDLTSFAQSSSDPEEDGSIIEKKRLKYSSGYLDIDSLKNNTKGEIQFIPLDSSFPQLTISSADLPKDILQDPETYSKKVFIASIENWSPGESHADGKLIKSIGNLGEYDAEMEGFLIENDVDLGEFSQEVSDCLPKEENWQIPTSELEYCNNLQRKDLRKSCIFTIDPTTAKDIDDALSCEDLSNGWYKVGVHIADVSYFVKPDTALDDVASNRATTYYLRDKAIPMLPKLLSEELCSLNPNVDRLAFSVEWVMNADGEILSEWYGRTIIKSCVKLSYYHAQGFIDDKNWSRGELPLISRPFGTNDIKTRIQSLQKLAVQIRKRRHESGGLRLDQAQLDLILDPETNRPIDYNLYQVKDSNSLIEEFMLLANRTVARVIKQKFPQKAVLRCHKPPKQDKLKELKRTCDEFGIEMDISSAGSIQKSLDKLNSRDDVSEAIRQVVVDLCIIPITWAEYVCAGTLKDDSQLNHYALNMPLYTHFTSPIRRYPDILVHRLLGSIKGYNCESNTSVEATQEILDNANERRKVAKLVGEKSKDLNFADFLKEYGAIETRVIVKNVRRNRIEIFAPKFGVSKTVLLKEINAPCIPVNGRNILINWRIGQKGSSRFIKQKVKLFTELNCILEVPNDQPGLKWQARILPPSGEDSVQTSKNENSRTKSSKKNFVSNIKPRNSENGFSQYI